MLTTRHTTLFGRLFSGAAVAVAVLAISSAPVMAQKRQQQQQQQQAAPEEEEVDQVELTQAQIDGFVTAQTKINPITAKLKGNAQPSKQMMTQMEGISKEVGFKDFEEFGNVGSNIGFVFGGIDPDTKKFVEPEMQIKSEIDKVNADAKMPAAQKKKALADLQKAMTSAPKLKFPVNAELVAKNYDKLKPVMQ